MIKAPSSTALATTEGLELQGNGCGSAVENSHNWVGRRYRTIMLPSYLFSTPHRRLR